MLVKRHHAPTKQPSPRREWTTLEEQNGAKWSKQNDGKRAKGRGGLSTF
jgi:hypothetical protein